MKAVVALLVLSAVPLLAGVLRLLGVAGLTGVEGHGRFMADPLPAILHVVCAPLFMTLGAFQFARGGRRSRWHRVVGRALVPMGTVAAATGVYMALRWEPKPLEDSAALVAIRVLVGGAMLVFIAASILALQKRDFASHGRWMTRAYALGAGAGTQVLTTAPVLVVDAIRTPRWMAVGMAVAWAINAAVAEWALRRKREASSEVMLALHHERYGGPEHLRLGPAAVPEPDRGQVRVRVCASSLNAMDVRVMRADPFLVRLQLGLFRPRVGRLGADFSGVVDAVGPGVKSLVVGDQVFGESFGTLAETIVVREHDAVRKPPSLTFVEAAALPLAGVTALQAVRDRARVVAGQRVLVQGAGGGVGMLIVQIARAYGAHVTAVCGPGNIERLRAIGADRIVDYTRDPLGSERYDVIFGVNGFVPLLTYRERLRSGGVYVMVGGSGRQLFEALLLGKLAFWRSGRRMAVLTIDAASRTRDLGELLSLRARGRLDIVIDKVFPFAEVVAAIRLVDAGHTRGKVIVEVSRPISSEAFATHRAPLEPEPRELMALG